MLLLLVLGDAVSLDGAWFGGGVVVMVGVDDVTSPLVSILDGDCGVVGVLPLLFDVAGFSSAVFLSP